MHLLKTFEKCHRRTNNKHNAQSATNDHPNENDKSEPNISSSTDHTNTDTTEDCQFHILAILHSLQNSCLQRGLLERDGTRVHQLQTIFDTSNSNDGGTNSSDRSMMEHNSSSKVGGSGRKKRRKGGGTGNGGAGGRIPSSMFVVNSGTSSSLEGCGGSSVSSYGEEGYVLSNMSRIVMSSSDGKRAIQSVYPPLIISAAVRVVACICMHCRSTTSGGDLSPASAVEFEMILSAGCHFLSGLAKIIQALGMEEEDGNIDNLTKGQDDETREALRACCTCATELITLIGTRLNRSTAIIQSIQTAAESILWNNHTPPDDDNEDALVTAAAALRAVIPLAGNADGLLPTKLLTNAVRGTATALLTTLSVFYPAQSSSYRVGTTTARDDNSKKRLRNDHLVSDQLDGMQWIEGIQSELTGQADRLRVFSTRIKGYTSLLHHLLRMDGYTNNGTTTGDGGGGSVTICCLPIATLLSTINALLTFSTLAESRYLTTRFKLRNLSVENGLLSPNAAITVASSLRRNGHLLFWEVASLLKSSNSSLQYSHRMIRSTVECLLSSSSGVLQGVIDPSSSSGSGGDGGRNQQARKWLHSSIDLRAMAVRSFACAVQSIGSHVTDDVYGRGLTLVAGCLLEQITPLGNDDCGEGEDISMIKEVTDEQWGTRNGLAHLISTCVDALDICLTSSGGFMPLPSREMVESICLTCLNHLNSYRSNNGTILFSYTDVKTSLLRLGLSCVSMPWSDGGASTLGGMLQKISSVLKFDRDETVAALASSAWCICNSNLTSRAPPLFLVTRVVGQGAIGNDVAKIQSQMRSSSAVLSQSNLIAGMRSAVEKGKIEKAKDEIEHASADSKKLASLEEKDLKKVVEVSTSATLGGGGEGGKASLHIKNHEVYAVDKMATVKQDGTMNSENNPKSMIDPIIRAKPKLELVDSQSNAIPSNDQHALTSKLPDDNIEEESDDEFPPIVDCDPDDEDMM